jgi:hypothetical protein
MYEHRKDPLLSSRCFTRRVAIHTAVAIGTAAVALGIGVIGYHTLAHLGWIDSLLNASMILGGMGPVDTLTSSAAKLFASVYALFSGLVFIGVATVLVAPFLHRLMHLFHLEGK